MSKNQPGSIGEQLVAFQNQIEIDARNQAYAVATQITQQVITRYGDHDAVNVVKYWSDLSDGVFKKIFADAKDIVNRK